MVVIVQGSLSTKETHLMKYLRQKKINFTFKNKEDKFKLQYHELNEDFIFLYFSPFIIFILTHKEL